MANLLIGASSDLGSAKVGIPHQAPASDSVVWAICSPPRHPSGLFLLQVQGWMWKCIEWTKWGGLVTKS